MKTTRSVSRSPQAGFTLVEVIISMTILSMVVAMALSSFLFGLRMMYKDNQRLVTNTTLKYFMAQVAKNTLDASEFYIYPSYVNLNGAMDPLADLTTAVTDSWGIDLYHGDCLVLVTRTSLEQKANIREVNVYYRTSSDPSKEGEIRNFGIRFEDEFRDPDPQACLDHPETCKCIYGTSKSLETVLDGIDLKSKPQYPGSRLLAARALGRPMATDPSKRYPIFSSKAPLITTENENVSINAEIINGNSVNNLLSSSSFNYTISPRR